MGFQKLKISTTHLDSTAQKNARIGDAEKYYLLWRVERQECSAKLFFLFSPITAIFINYEFVITVGYISLHVHSGFVFPDSIAPSTNAPTKRRIAFTENSLWPAVRAWINPTIGLGWKETGEKEIHRKDRNRNKIKDTSRYVYRSSNSMFFCQDKSL